MANAGPTTESEVDGGFARGHRAAVFVAALGASAGCFSLVPGDTLEGSLAQGALLTAVALVAVGLSHPRALRAPHRACGGLSPWVGYLLLVGAAAGSASLAMAPDLAFDLGLARVAQVTALCLLTGVFEEGVFRVLALDAFVPALGGGSRGTMRAAIVSAVLFGVMHGSLGPAASGDAVAVAQAVVKPLQAGLFGFFMAAAYAATRNLWALAFAHAAFDLLYIGPLLLAGDLQRAYVTGDVGDLALLVVTTALLVPAAIAAARSFRKNSPNP